MKKICSRCFVILGALLVISALSLLLYNINQDKKSGESAEKVNRILKQQIEIAQVNSEVQSNVETTELPPTNDLFAEYESQEDVWENKDESFEIDGNLYIGLISIPSLSIELPVMSEWNYDNLKVSPCRYKGSIEENNLIIAGHNYKSHFGNIQNLNSGDIITFTDINGNVIRYEVIHSQIIDGYNTEEIANSSENWDLSIFTCTLSGQSRITVRAVKID